MHSVMYDEKKSTHEKTGQMLNNCTRRGGKIQKLITRSEQRHEKA